MSNLPQDVTERVIEPMLVAGIRMKGRYGECGKAFGRIRRALGRHCAGPAMMLHYDTQYKETDADFEPCFRVKQAKTIEGISVRELPGGKCVSLIHQGPYEELPRSYERIVKYIHDKGYTPMRPCREVYLKGPGMIFKGNPKKYLTEIQFLIEPAKS